MKDSCGCFFIRQRDHSLCDFLLTCASSFALSWFYDAVGFQVGLWLYGTDRNLQRSCPGGSRRIHHHRCVRQGGNILRHVGCIRPKTNEILVGKALKKLPREKVQLATKFGALQTKGYDAAINGRPEYVRSCCEASLKHLDVDYIDLYYVHRIDTSVPIEETMGELKKLVEEGKVKYIGLSEASPDTIRRAHAVHPVTALQIEWSLWTRDIEQELVPLCRELGIGIVPYSPVGRGFFGGRGVIGAVPGKSLQERFPRFQPENLEKNKVFYTRIKKLANKHDCTPIQLALAWVLHQGDDVVPIPVKLAEDDLREISDAVPIEEVVGGSTHEGYARLSWRYADTPPLRAGKLSA
ncbi:hypothetical protein EUGRSUZ_H04373 [Eucalyptus grandis]|uniref:Uncharacterized protein n=2 Tax=Eucalyptus grandis TaxID=71139 RepID=A0ACC3JXA2_EUCGR|nr:hypothetical protein EUGRSUZ_H04373 [Eucalyptus grandis]